MDSQGYLAGLGSSGNGIWLVVTGAMEIYIGNGIIIPTDELSIIFQRGRVETTNQL